MTLLELPQPKVLTMALALCRIQVDEPTSDLIIQIVKAIEQQGGKLTLDEITEIEASVQARWQKTPEFNTKQAPDMPA